MDEERFGKFGLLNKVREGQLGVLYQAEDTVLRRQVSLMVLNPDLGEDHPLRQRVVREAQVALQLEHPAIVRVLDIGETEGRFFISSEIPQGTRLDRLLERVELPPDKSIAILRRIAEGLDYAHRKGIIHRNLAPESIVITEDLPAILDFGMAFDADIPGESPYVSPERINGDIVTRSSDIYSLGVMAAEMLTGETLVRTPDTLPVEDERQDTRLSLLNAGVQSALRKAMSRNIATRYPSALAFVDALENAIADAETDEPPAEPVPVMLPVVPHPELLETRRRTSRGALLGLAGFVAAVVVLALTLPRSETVHHSAGMHADRAAGSRAPTPSPPVSRAAVQSDARRLAARAEALCKGGKYLPAIDMARQALEEDPACVDAYDVVAVSRYLLKEYEASAYASRTALKIAPGHADALANLAAAELALGHEQTALAAARTCLNAHPDEDARRLARRVIDVVKADSWGSDQ